MGFDSIANASVPAFSKDFAKKKRTNRLAKLKQCKLDARREQWLSQAKNKESKEESNGGTKNEFCSPPSLSMMLRRGRNPSFVNQETGSRGEENERSSSHDSDLESLMNSSITTDSSRKDRPGSSCGSSSGSTSSGYCSRNFSEEEDDDGCLDDWEAVADALTAVDKQHDQNSEPPSEQEIHVEPDACVKIKTNKSASGVDISKPARGNMIPRTSPSNCAWKTDDAFRPQSLPNLSKQGGFSMNSEQRRWVRGANPWARSVTVSQPSSCPICYEDLDLTDSSFTPCMCGFRLCLFCYKRIFEVGDSRCPGCRRSYDPIDGNSAVNGGLQPDFIQGNRAYGLPRSCSMSKRSLGKVSH